MSDEITQPRDELSPVPDPGAMTEAESKLAEAIALVRGGEGYQTAAQQVGIATMTLFRAVQRVYTNPAIRESALESAEKRIEGQVTLIAEAAGERVLEALATGAEVGKNDAVLYGIASDKIMRLRGLDRNQDRASSGLDFVMERLAKLNLEAEVTIRPHHNPAETSKDEPRDVSPSSDAEGPYEES